MRRHRGDAFCIFSPLPTKEAAMLTGRLLLFEVIQVVILVIAKRLNQKTI